MHRTLGMSPAQSTGALMMAAVLSASCGIDDFEEVITDEATLPASRMPAVVTQGMYAGELADLNLSQAREFQNQGVSPGDVDGIYVKSIALEMDTGSGNPMIDRLRIYVESMELWVESPGIPRKTIATLTNVPDSNVADLVIESDFVQADGQTGLKPNAVAESMSIGADVVLTEQGAMPFLNITLRTTVTLVIDVNVLGI